MVWELGLGVESGLGRGGLERGELEEDVLGRSGVEGYVLEQVGLGQIALAWLVGGAWVSALVPVLVPLLLVGVIVPVRVESA